MLSYIYLWPSSLGNYGATKQKKIKRISKTVLCGEKREKVGGRRLLNCQGCLAFDEEEFEWAPGMSVGYGV